MKQIIILILFISASFITNGQELKNLINSNKNYNEIEKAIKKDEKILEKASVKERKMYDRWNWFWKSRVDSSGNFDAFNSELNKYFYTLYPEGTVEENLS